VGKFAATKKIIAPNGHDIEHDEGADADEADDQSLKTVSRHNT
jgi:hypothetical protein